VSPGDILIGAGLILSSAGTFRYGMRLTVADLIADVLVTSGAFLVAPWPYGAACAALTALTAWRLWRRRKRRDRAPRELGYKARVTVAALVRRVREAGRPRPVLQPVPGGAR
jgi:membrane protein implicated in regulation of membrane protease activity